MSVSGFPKTSFYRCRKWYVMDAGLIGEIDKLQKSGTRKSRVFLLASGFPKRDLARYLPYFTISISNENPSKLESATEQPLY